MISSVGLTIYVAGYEANINGFRYTLLLQMKHLVFKFSSTASF